jgi:hypothetical protein
MEDEYELEVPLYCTVGARPVKSERNAKGNLTIYAYNWEDGSFEHAMDYYDRLYMHNQDDVTFISAEEFEAYVQSLEEKRLKKMDK